VKVGLIGLGVMGKNHLRVFQSLDTVQEIIVQDVAEVALADKRKVTSVKTIEDLISSRPDYAAISVPTAFHLSAALALAEGQIPTLLEKPVAASLDESLRIMAAYANTKTLCAVGHIERFNPALQVLKSKIAEGVIGNLLQISSMRMGPFPHRINDVGVVRDLASHDIDLAMWLTGLKYEDLSTLEGHTRESNHEDLFIAIGRLGKNVLVNHMVNWLNPVKVRQTAVLGTKGLLVADSLRVELRFFENGVVGSEWGQYSNLRGVSEGGEVRYPMPVREPLVTQHEAMIKSIERGSISEICSIEEGLEVMKVIERILGH
jgi:UDP-N-acetylglucosamine 3-dehydrogenase